MRLTKNVIEQKLTKNEKNAINKFIEKNGRFWRIKLTAAWFTSNYVDCIIENKDDITYLQRLKEQGYLLY